MRLTPLLVAAAVGAAAHPSVHPHRHLHRSASQHSHSHTGADELKKPVQRSEAPHNHAHVNAADLLQNSKDYVEKRDTEKRDGEQITVTIEGKIITYKKGQSPFMKHFRPSKAVPSPSPSPTPAASPPPPVPTPAKPASDDNGLGPAGFQDFCSGSKSKRVELFDVMYTGNTGKPGNYGCNVKLVQASAKDSYKYTSKFVGGNQSCKCKIWLKIGPDGGVNGFFNGNEVLSFDLKAGTTQWAAYDENTQGAACCTCGGGEIPLTPLGQFNCPWAEFDFGNSKNKAWSGADASTIVTGVYGGKFDPLDVTNPKTGVSSKVFRGGGGVNAFLPGFEFFDGLGHNDVPGNCSYVFDFSH